MQTGKCRAGKIIFVLDLLGALTSYDVHRSEVRVVVNLPKGPPLSRAGMSGMCTDLTLVYDVLIHILSVAAWPLAAPNMPCNSL